MTALEITCIVAGAVTGYAVAIGVTYSVLRDIVWTGPGGWQDHDDLNSQLGAAFWPLVLPVVAGVLVTRWLRRRRIPEARVVEKR